MRVYLTPGQQERLSLKPETTRGGKTQVLSLLALLVQKYNYSR